MKTKVCFRLIRRTGFLLLCSILVAQTLTAFGQGTTFTYQGRLVQAGSPYHGPAEMQFTLFDVPSGGAALVTNTPATASVEVSNGLFVLALDFGASAFNGNARWLEIAVRTNAALPFTTLAPRQQILAAPYAMTAREVTGGVAAEQLVGTILVANIGSGTIHSNHLAVGSVTAAALADGVIHSNHLAIGSIHSNLLAVGSVTAAALADGAIHSNHLAIGSIHSNLLAVGSVTAAALADGAIHSNHLAVGSIHSNLLAVGSVTAAALADGAIHSNHLAIGSIHSNLLAVGSVTAAALADGAIHSNHLAIGSIHSNLLAVGSVTEAALADGVIHSNHLAVGSIHSNLLAVGSVTAAALADGAIHSNHLAIGSVHSNALALGSVTADALAAGSIHSNHLAVGSILSEHLVVGSITSNHLAPGSVSLDGLSTAVGGSFSRTLNNPNPQFDFFGLSVATLGADMILIGAYNSSIGGDNAGAAYLLSTSGALIKTFLKPVPGNQDRFGISVAVVGPDKVLIGADSDNTGLVDAGAAYLFSTNGTLITTFTNPSPAAADSFGYSVAAVGDDKVVIGAYADHSGVNAGGAAYLFTTNQTLLATFNNPSPASGDRFGIAVAAVGADKVLIGADRDDDGATDSGVAYLFHISGTLLATFNNPTPWISDGFGGAVAAVGLNAVLIGAPGDSSGGNLGGAAYLFNTAGTLLTTFTNPTPAVGDQFGIAVAAVDGNRVLIGASSDDSGTTDAGAVYLISINGALLSTFNNPAPASGDLFGQAVTALGPDKILVGAPQDNGGSPASGAAHLFALTAYLPGLALDPSSGTWLKSGANISYSAGNVGIGTANPLGPLHIVGPAGAPPANPPGAENGLLLGTAGTASYKWVQTYGGALAINPLGNNVGIGTASPGAKLDVRGDVKLGAAGQFFAPGAVENLRILRGRINSAGGITTGTGFTVSKTGTGAYTVTFTTAFSAEPTVTATPQVALARLATCTAVGAASAQFRTFDSANAAIDQDFHFIAIGPR